VRCSYIVTLTLWVLGGAGSASADGLRGPDRPLDGPSVIITKDAIAINESRRLNWKRFWAKRRGYRVVRFKKSRLATLDLAANRQLKTKFRAVHDRLMGSQARSKGAMNIMVGADVPARTVAQVIVAAAQQEFSSFVLLAPDSSPPHGLRFDVPTFGGGHLPRPLDEVRKGEGFAVTLWWRSEAFQVLIQGRYGDRWRMNHEEYDPMCSVAALRFDGKCPALPHRARRVDQERLSQFAQSICAGNQPYEWLATLSVDGPFEDLFQAGLIVHEACGSRIVWTAANPSWPTRCDDSIDLARARQRLSEGWCEPKAPAPSGAKPSIFD
jgi:hypothetical protein